MALRTERGDDVAQRDQRLVDTTALFQAVAASTGSVRSLASDVNKQTTAFHSDSHNHTIFYKYMYTCLRHT